MLRETNDISASVFTGKERVLNVDIFKALALNPGLAPSQIRKTIQTPHNENAVSYRLKSLSEQGFVCLSGQRAGTKIESLTIFLYSLTSKGCLVATSIDDGIDYTKYQEKSFFFGFAEFLRSAGLAPRAWVLGAMRDAVRGGLLKIDSLGSEGAEANEEAFTALSFFVSNRLKSILPSLDTTKQKALYDVLSSKQASRYRAYLPRVMDIFYKTGIARPGERETRSCLQCGIHFRAVRRIASSKFCSFQCYWSSYNLLPRKQTHFKCAITECQNFVYLRPSELARNPTSLHFCKVHRYRKKNLLKVTCGCGCGTQFEIVPSREKVNKLGFFFSDHYYHRFKKVPTEKQLATLERGRIRSKELAKEAHVKTNCAGCGKTLDVLRSEKYNSKTGRERQIVCDDCKAKGIKAKWTLTPEQRQKHSESQRRHLRENPQAIEIIRQSKLGKKRPSHVRQALSEARKSHPPNRGLGGKFVKKALC